MAGRFRWIVAVSLLVVSLLAAAERVNKLKPTGYVNDFAQVLNGRTSSDIHQLCQLIEEKAGAQIAVVTIRSLDGVEAPDFANKLFAKWGVGHKDNRGVLILLAVDDHKYFVEVGYGLEPILPDGKVGGFGREMVPFLKRGDYNNGVLLLTQRIAAVIAQDRGVTLPPQTPIQAPAGQPRGPSRGNEPAIDGKSLFFLILAAIFIFLSVVAAVLRAIWRFLVFLITGKRPPRSRGWFGAAPGGFWMGGGGSGGWSGGFGGGGGFGGFGGGMSGGGGAGGSW